MHAATTQGPFHKTSSLVLACAPAKTALLHILTIPHTSITKPFSVAKRGQKCLVLQMG